MNSDGMVFFELWYFVASIIASFVIAGIASERKRNTVGWFLFSFTCSPLIAGVCLAACREPIGMVAGAQQVPNSTAEVVMTTENNRTPQVKPKAEAEPPISKEETDRRYNEWLAKKK